MAYEHPSALSGAYDRTPSRPDWSEVIARDSAANERGYYAQASDINEVQAILRRRIARTAELVARDGDRRAGAAISVDAEAGTISLSEGQIYARGDVRLVPARVITDVALAGDVLVGIRLLTTYVTEEDDPSLYGLHPGSLSEGEPGSARGIETASWALSDDEGAGDFVQVYLVKGGTVIDQTAPPALTGITQALAQYDRGSNGGNYITSGCRVTALAIAGGSAHYSIEEGEANIWGFKRTRLTALRHSVPLDWQVEEIAAEPHTFADGGTGTAVIQLNRGPIDTVTSVVITVEVTETMTRGFPSGTSDALGHPSVSEIVGVSQGATTYVAGTDYVRAGDHVSWAPAGAEPAGGSSYDVTYRYLASVPLGSVIVGTDTVTVSGGVTGSLVTVAYSWRLPRIDLMCLDQTGQAVYVPGVPARERPVPPIAPANLLALATLHQDWRGPAVVVNDGTRNVPYPLMWRYFSRLVDLLDLVALERLKSDIDRREPVAKRGLFVDPCTSDYYRDQGEEQSAAVFNGSIQLAIDPEFHVVEMAGPIMLDYVPEVIIRQERVTGCVKVNPYASFEPLPGVLLLTPAQDFWVETRTEWLSPQTARISGTSARTTVNDVVVDQRDELLDDLRQIELAFVVRGLAPGELLTSLVFDGVDVTPNPVLAGDAHGEAAGTFTIPAGILAGAKSVEATGGSGMKAFATFVGQGYVETTVMQRLTAVGVTPRPTSSFSGANLGLGVKDPQGQSFAATEPRHLLGVDVRACALGNPANGLLFDLVTIEAGQPSTDVRASALVSVADVEVGDWIEARWPAPAIVRPELMAFTVGSDDNVHSISCADVGGFDIAGQQYLGAQPYTVGDRFDGSNGITWLPHPGSDLTFRVVACRFTATTKTVVLGEIDLVDCSDLMIAATVDLPSADCSFRFEVHRPGGEIIVMLPGQVREFTEYLTETVELRAVLTGTETVSPTLYPGVMVIAGKLRATGTYVTRAFTFGTDIRLPVRFKALLPAGSAVTVEYDLADDDWTAIALTESETIDGGWAERTHEVDHVTGSEGRIRLTLTGTPAARPSLADIRVPTI